VKTKIIWRCKPTSIREDSGAALLRVGRRLGDLVHEWHIECHEIPPDRLSAVDCIGGEKYFKIALSPPEGIRTRFHPVAPNQILRSLELEIMNLPYLPFIASTYLM
jgi:hypothetical protein